MSTMELEVQKAGLAREILSETDETIVKNLWVFLKRYKSVPTTKETGKYRTIGLLEGKAVFKEVGDGKITTEEFLGI